MKISIIVPVFNTKIEHLNSCINSIYASIKTFKYEILLVNDGSFENETVNFINSFKGENIQIFNRKNEGVSSARNYGLSIAKGEYILFLDSDDLLTNEINNAILLLDNNNNIDIIYSNIEYFGDINKIEQTNKFSILRQVYIGNNLAITSLFRRKIININTLFDINYNYIEDRLFWAKLSNQGATFYHYPKPFFKYRRINNGNSLSQISYEKKKIYEENLINSFNPREIINIENINQYVLNNFKTKKTHLIKLILILFFPSLTKLLIHKKIIKNKIVID